MEKYMKFSAHITDTSNKFDLNGKSFHLCSIIIIFERKYNQLILPNIKLIPLNMLSKLN